MPSIHVKKMEQEPWAAERKSRRKLFQALPRPRSEFARLTSGLLRSDGLN